MKILFATSECVPFCKTGGLADVVGALPKELRKRRHDVRVILPKYKSIRAQEFSLKETGETIHVPLANRWEEGDIRLAKGDKGLKTYFINNDNYFGRTGLYGGSEGEYKDNAERFIFFCRGVLEACKAIEFRPDIIHCHDWQTGLIPAYLKTLYKKDAFFQHTAVVFTIHNIAYQGVFHKEYLPLTGLGWQEFTMDKLEFYDMISFLKAGITYADMLTTVSPTYSRQIQSSPEFGRGMEGTLQKKSSRLAGILNGLDLDEWNPAKDPFLPKLYDAQALQGRKECKASLQESLRLPVSAKTPLLGVVARLDVQKGIDMLCDVVPQLMAMQVQLVVLGQGHPTLQRRLEHFEKHFPNSFRYRHDFNEPLAHHIYGGCDLFLMPSRFEPCGLSQLIAMRYGAIPVVAGTGGLLDTVLPYGPKDQGTGFLFYDLTGLAFLEAIRKALKVFYDAPAWQRLQSRAMQTCFSWEASTDAYLSVYRQALGRSIPRPSGRKIARR